MKKVIKVSIAFAIITQSLPALAEVVVVVNPKAAEVSLTKEQVTQIFLGKSATMTPVDHPENAPIRAEFYRKVTDKDTSQVKALWSKLLFTGKATMPKEAADSAAVKKLVASDTKAIGYIEKSAVDSSVKVIYTAQ